MPFFNGEELDPTFLQNWDADAWRYKDRRLGREFVKETREESLEAVRRLMAKDPVKAPPRTWTGWNFSGRAVGEKFQVRGKAKGKKLIAAASRYAINRRLREHGGPGPGYVYTVRCIDKDAEIYEFTRYA